ncbi:ribosomal RNA processing protein 1 homolog B-like isoform X1 [Pygocentrus nattereri]|uniref:Ribosomal RNA processing 1B n=2 Tax=Pygocentrus nattereri TaxID=42514 RepID=A0AAR2IUR4_PYGNA|nr:ribosomal RNA processing protein 1 homolog B-like isoform X1 [Pygocentrus nattereri]
MVKARDQCVIELRGRSTRSEFVDEDSLEKSRNRNMAAARTVTQGPETALAQRLAANEKSVRTKALKTLRKYINLRSQKEGGGFTCEDLMKIWKGLFYCLWMQDKPLLQEELSQRISGLIHCFHTADHQLLYFETFLQTLKREWNGIDRLRMDKFYQLVRFVFRKAFEVLKRRAWDTSLVNRFLEVFTVQLLQSTGHVPDGLMFHVLELYMTELAWVGAAELTAEQNLTFIGPFCKTMAKTKDRSVLTSISKNIFSTIVDHASYAVEDLIKELNCGEDTDSGQASEDEEESVEDEPNSSVFKKAKGKKVDDVSDAEESEGSEDELLDLDNIDPKEKLSDDDIGPVLQFDYSALADRLFELGSHTNTPNLNRAKMYRLVKIFSDLSEGFFPQDDVVVRKENKKKRRYNAEAAEEESAAKKLKACEDVQKREPEQDDATNDGRRITRKKKEKQKHEGQTAQVQTETNMHISQTAVETPLKAGGTPEKNGTGTAVTVSGVVVDLESQSLVMDNKPRSQSEMTASARKKRKIKNLKSEFQEIVEEIAAEHEDADKKCHTNTEITKCPGPDELEAQTNLSGRTKSGKKDKRNNGEEPSPSQCMLINVLHMEDISTSASAKKPKSATVHEKIAAEIGPDVRTLDEKPKNSSSSLVETTLAEYPEGGILKKKKRQKIKKATEEEDKAGIDDVKNIEKVPKERNAPIETVDNASATIIVDATNTEEQRSAASTIKKKKSKKQKLKEISVEINQVDLEVKEPEVPKDPTGEGQTSEAKALEKEKKKNKRESSKKQLDAEAEVEAACRVPSVLKKKKTQKKQKMQLVDLTVYVNEECQSVEATEEPELKKKRKQKPKAAAENGCSPTTPLKKCKKKRNMQTEETSQENEHTVKVPEIAASVMPKKKLKMKNASSKSDFAFFQGQIKTPSPLFCKVKSKGSPSTPLSTIKTFQISKSETKKVTFGLKNNKTTEFRKTDRSLLVSPVGSSRVAFDPKKTPICSVLKSPASSPSVSVKKLTAKRRPTAADFF